MDRQSALSVDIDKFDWNIPQEEDIENHKIRQENIVMILIKLAEYTNQSQKKKIRHLQTRRTNKITMKLAALRMTAILPLATPLIFSTSTAARMQSHEHLIYNFIYAIVFLLLIMKFSDRI